MFLLIQISFYGCILHICLTRSGDPVVVLFLGLRLATAVGWPAQLVRFAEQALKLFFENILQRGFV